MGERVMLFHGVSGYAFHYFFSLSGTSPLTCRETYMCMCHWVLFDFVQSTLVYTLTVTQANNL